MARAEDFGDAPSERLQRLTYDRHSRLDAVKRVSNSIVARKNIGLLVLIVLYVGWFIHQSLSLYYSYGDAPFDLAIFDQGLWLLSHFHVPFVTVMGRNLLGDHTSFVLVLFAPFYRLFREPQGLLVVQTLLLAGPAVPIYLLAQKYIKHTLIATSLAATYLLNPLLQQGNLNQFHPEAFQVLFISLAIYAAWERKYRALVVMAVLSLLVKEDAALLIVPLGLWVAVRRDRKLGLLLVGAALLWAMVANWLIIPSLLGSSSFYASRIPFGGISGLFTTLVQRPGQLWHYLGSQGRLFYLWQLASTVGFTFLAAPEIALVGVLVVAENIVSNDPYMHQIAYQYSMPLAPILVMGVLFAIAKQVSLRRQVLLSAVTLMAALWSCVAWGYAPFSINQVPTGWIPASASAAAAYVERALPPDAVVSAWYPFVSHLDHRRQIYVWPNPFSAQNWGLLTTTGQRLTVANNVQYLLLPVPLSSSDNPDVLQQISATYRCIRSRGGFALYEKKVLP